jgi:hypothetical protein
MKVIGIELRKPGPWGITFAVVLAVLLWAMAVLSGLGPSTKVAAGSALVAMLWGTISASIGIEAAKGGRHLAVSLLGCVVVLGVYSAIVYVTGA